MAAIAMAEKSNRNKSPGEEEQALFPVLTVLKNKAILKNIVMVIDHNKKDQTILLGRHPDCTIVLSHPSVSRFHLKIRSNPSSRTLSLVDMASVHGTWVCGRKLKPWVSVKLNEADTFTVGFSTRLYRISWVPLAQLDVFVPQQQEKHDEQGDIIKDEKLELTAEQEIQMSEDIVSLCCDEDRKSHSEDEALRALNGTKTSCFPVSLCCDEERKNHSEDEASGVLNRTETSCFPTNSNGENITCDCQDHVLSPPYIQSPPHAQPVDELDNTDKIEACPEEPGETNLLCTLGEYLKKNICLLIVEAVQGTKMQQFQAPSDTFTGQPPSSDYSSLPTNIDPTSFDEKDVAAEAVIPTESEFGCTHEDNDKVEGILTTGPRTFNSENICLIVEDIADSEFHQMEVVEEVFVDSVPDGEKQDEFQEEYKSQLQDLNAKSCCEVGYLLDEIVEDNGKKCIKNLDPTFFYEMGLAAVTLIPTESEFGCTLGDNERIEDILEMEARTITSENISLLDNTVGEVAMDSTSVGEKEDKCGKELESKLPASLNAESCQEQGNSAAEIAEDNGKNCASSISSTSFRVESSNSSMLQKVVLNITIENQTPQSLTAVTGCSGGEFLENHVEPTEKSPTFGSIWSRRCNAASAPQVRDRKSRFIMSTSKIDTEVKKKNVKDVINKSMPKDLSSVFDEEEEKFKSNKENLSPSTYHLWFMRKKGKLEENKHYMSQRSPNLSYFSPSIYSAKSIIAVSNKVNQTPKVAQEWKSQRKPLECRTNLVHEQDIIELKKNRLEKVVFQSLMNSGGNHKSVTVSAAKSIDDAFICGQISNKYTKPSQHISREQKRSWDMVVDTGSLLNKESRKALQLLQGLIGTHLIIPRLVIRELGSMKQQFRIFRTTSEASLALEWIEECLEKTRWWIHIQSPMEECRLTDPTPPASPQTQFIEESWAFPGFKISKKCASPTTVVGHILDCALQYRRKEDVGQLVLLSDDVSLKIKSMEMGLLCETVQQFRHSLVNPFSERFMWPQSSPRGLTWSCKDDLVLRDKYCRLPSKAGLKLIINRAIIVSSSSTNSP